MFFVAGMKVACSMVIIVSSGGINFAGRDQLEGTVLRVGPKKIMVDFSASKQAKDKSVRSDLLHPQLMDQEDCSPK